MATRIKITVVGDGTVGKTCMIIAYTLQQYIENYLPVAFEPKYAEKNVDGIDYNIALWDTAGQEDYERLRPLSYPKTSCFLICYSISDRASYENVKTKWEPEVRHHMPNTPIILVGTKCDLRKADDPNLILLTEEVGNKMKTEVMAEGYFECSAKEIEGLDPIIKAAVRSSIKSGKKKTRECAVL